MLSELARRNLVFEHLIELGRSSAGDLWEHKESDDARDGTCNSEAGGVSDELYVPYR
jgi:hypothetical protein